MKEQKTASRFYVAGFIWIVLFATTSIFVIMTNEHRIEWDGQFYTATLHSLYFDKDIDFANEAEQYPWMIKSFGKPLPNGLLSNPFPIGSSILWLPFYSFADLSCRVTHQVTCDGYSEPYVVAIMIATVFWTTLGLVINGATLAILFKSSKLLRIAITLIVSTLASPLIFYLIVDVDYSHGNSFFAVSLLLYLTVVLLEKDVISHKAMLFYGLTLGLTFLIRWQDTMMGLVAMVVLLRFVRARSFLVVLSFLLGLFLGALPQLMFWQHLYGSFVTIPQSGSFMSFSNIDILKFLFSTWNGVFLWHPMMLISLGGLGVFLDRMRSYPLKEYRLLAIMLLVIMFLELLVSAMARDWWSGGSFGQRRLTSTLPILAVGLYDLINRMMRLKRKTLAVCFTLVATVLISWNILTLVRFKEKVVPFNPADPNSYTLKNAYGHFDYGRRFSDIFTGRRP